MSTYTELTTISEWQDVFEQTSSEPTFVLKHSTRCPVSAEAYEVYKEYLSSQKDDIASYLVKVIESRDVSNAIEKDTKIKHESPQLLLIKDKEVVWSATHFDIKEDAIREASGSVKE